MGFIYMIQGPMGKKYIGQTKKTIEYRFKQHCNQINSKNCTYLHNAMKKYGINKFTYEIIDEVDNDFLDNLEIYYINEYNTLVPNGYNLQTGGSAPKMHKETRERISKFL